MRILQFCTAFGTGGIARHAVDLGLWLRQQGHSIHFAGVPGVNMDEQRGDHFLTLEVDLVSGNGGILARCSHALSCALKLRNFLRRNKIDLIHCHESAPAIVAHLASVGMNLPILLTFHGSNPERVRQFALTAKVTAELVIAPSHRSAEELIQEGGLEPSKICVIGLGVKSLPLVDDEEKTRLRKELLGENGRLLIVVVARIAYQKGIDILIKVVEKISRFRDDIQVAVVGDGPLRTEMEALSKSSGVGDFISFVGNRANPHIYLHAADLFVLTSRWEALPLSIVEAFRAGLPVVAADTSGVEELVDSSVGKVLPIGDVDAFVQSILRLCGDDKLRRKLAAEALKRSTEDRFDPDYIHRIFEKTYLEFLK